MKRVRLSDKHKTTFKSKFNQEAIEAFCGLLSTQFGFDLHENTNQNGLDSEVPADLRAIINLLNKSEVDNERMGLFIPFEYIKKEKE